MIATILQQTPLWVWAILIALIGLGLMQSVARTVTLRRVLVLPLAMTTLSLHGTFNHFPPATWSWVMWIGAAMVSATWFATGDLPAGARFDAGRQVFELPGSWQPMALMISIFCTRYLVAVVLAMTPSLAGDPATAAIVSSIYGALSGVFIGRLLRMLHAARETSPRPTVAPNAAWG